MTYSFVQIKSDETAQLLNKPYVNEVCLTTATPTEAAEAVLAKPEVVNALVVIVSSFNLLGLASCGK